MSETVEASAPKGTDKEAVIKRMDLRFKRAQEWEGNTRALEKDDKLFANGDPDHPEWQWPGDVYKQRTNPGGAPRPCLVINKVRQHNLLIINDSRENKPSVKVHATGFGAQAEAAQIFEGVIRHIEYKSKASAVYIDATRHQVESGIGYWRIVTEYPNDDSFEQEIFIRRVSDPHSVYIDPDAQEVDKSDARWAFIFRDLPREEFEAEFPEYKDLAGAQSMENTNGGSGNDWRGKSTVRVAEYYERHAVTDTLWALPQDFLHEGHPGGTFRESDIKQDGLVEALKASNLRSRPAENVVVRWYLRVGDEVVDQQDTAYNSIPIVSLIGEEFVADGVLNRRGHTRTLKDAQRMYNYYASQAVELGALQSKSPWLTDTRAIEGYEDYWKNANTTSYAYLPYNGLDDSGQKVDPPQRVDPAAVSPIAMQGMQTAEIQMMMASGQYQNEFGQQGNERSGVAIQERQRQGDKATYHFIDNLGIAIAYTGRILIDLIPKVYDTKRVIQIMGEDGTISNVMLDPGAGQAHQATGGPPQQGQGQPTEEIIFNPTIGRYAVEAEMGPGYATRREEAFNAFQQVVTSEGGQLYMDLFFQSADFPLADEAAERARNMLPPQATGGPPAALIQAQQHIQQLTAANTGLVQQMAEMKRRLDEKAGKQDIEQYRAETDRITSLHDIDPEMFRPLIRQVVLESLRDSHGGTAPPVAATLPHPNTPLPVPQLDNPQPAGASA